MDIAVTWNSTLLRAEWIISKGGFLLTPGLQTSVMCSLFTNKRAPADWKPPAGGPQSRGGYWGDTYSPQPIGSWLWLLYRSSIGDQQSVLSKAAFYCQDALAWLKRQGLVSSIDVQTAYLGSGAIGIQIEITPPGGQPVTFSFVWPLTGGPGMPVIQG